jgi:ribose-phosphate pyrophosphokinase
MNAHNVLLFRLTANPLLAEEVASLLGIPLSPSEISYFADGEALAKPLCSVRGKTVYIIQSTNNPAAEKLMELFIFVNGLKNAKAEKINVVMPYYGFSRQDRIVRPGEPITAKLVADLLQTAGVSHVITVDLHTPQIQGFFSCPVDSLTPIPLFASYYKKKLEKLCIETQDTCVVSPDHGSLHRAHELASALSGCAVAVIDKRRPAPNVSEVVNVTGAVKGKTCIIIDDIIDTAGTILSCSDALFENGAKDVLVGGTHGVLSHGSVEKLRKSPIKDIVVTNTIEKDISGINVISIAPIIAGVIKATEDGTAVPDSWMEFY